MSELRTYTGKLLKAGKDALVLESKYGEEGWELFYDPNINDEFKPRVKDRGKRVRVEYAKEGDKYIVYGVRIENGTPTPTPTPTPQPQPEPPDPEFEAESPELEPEPEFLRSELKSKPKPEPQKPSLSEKYLKQDALGYFKQREIAFEAGLKAAIEWLRITEKAKETDISEVLELATLFAETTEDFANSLQEALEIPTKREGTE